MDSRKYRMPLTLGMTLALVIMGLWAAVGTSSGEVDVKNVDESIVPEEIVNGPITEERPNFPGLVRAVRENYTGVIPMNHLHWDMLPPIKQIFTADSSYEFLMAALEHANPDDNITIKDQDEDGIPEMVIWRNVTRFHRTLRDEDVTLVGVRSFTLRYMDRDDDMNPEMISLNVRIMAGAVDEDGNVMGRYSSHWSGMVMDGDDDGSHNLQVYRRNSTLVIDRNVDGKPDMKRFSSISYGRYRGGSSTSWNIISFRAERGLRSINFGERVAIKGNYIDRDGDGWPERISGSRVRTSYTDRDGDGNAEIRSVVVQRIRFLDRNDDHNPELVILSEKTVTAYDRDSDGRVDLIRKTLRRMIWIDRDSDGRPEFYKVINSSIIRRPVLEGNLNEPETPEDVRPSPYKNRPNRR